MNTVSSNYTINTYSRQEIEKGVVSMDDIINDIISGFIVEDFLSATEVDIILQGFRSLSEKELTPISSSFNSYPMSFAQYDQLLQKKIISDEHYFEVSNSFIDSFKKRFGVDVFQRIVDLFEHVKDAPKVDIPYKLSPNNRYVPFTFRELFPGEGCLKAHCENLFFHEFPSFFEKIYSFSKLEHQLSFFIVLQNPSIGGELTLFDVLWDDRQQRIGDDHIQLSNTSVLSFDDKNNLFRDYIKPKVGSILVFSGGKIWHRVETVKAAPSRITLGGFLSFSHDMEKIYSWS